jgi:hypothetical protein
LKKINKQSAFALNDQTDFYLKLEGLTAETNEVVIERLIINLEEGYKKSENRFFL